jgi:hypothetical protein
MSKPSPEEQKERLLALARELAPKPTLIGTGATHLGWWATLNGTEKLLEELTEERKLRHASERELRRYGMRFGYLPV